MKLDDIRELIINSDRDDWNEIEAGPYFTDAPDIDEDTFRQHLSLLVYRPDVRLTVQWGLRWHHEDLTKSADIWPDSHFPDPSAHVELADVFWNGTLVDREHVVVVDGGRATLPMGTRRPLNFDPARPLDMETKTIWEYSATRWQTGLAQLLDSGREFDRYFQATGMIIKD